MYVRLRKWIPFAVISIAFAWWFSHAHPVYASSWDISRASYDSISKAFGHTTTDFYISPDGESLYIGYYTTSGSPIYQYSLSPAWDITSASLVRSKALGGYQTSMVEFSADGTKLYVLYYTSYLRQYTLSTPWDVSTAANSVDKYLGYGNHYGGTFSPDGLHFYDIESTQNRKITEYNLETAWDITTMVAANKTYTCGSYCSYGYDMALSSDGTTYFIAYKDAYDSSKRQIRQYTMSTPWDISTSSFYDYIDTLAVDPNNTGVQVSADDSKFYTCDYGTNTLYQFSLSDTVNPTVTSISSDSPSGSYKAGASININITFSEAVTSTGDVTVTLRTGSVDRTCTFSVSNSTTGTCAYTVQSGDTSSDLDAVISGTIKDQSDNSMTNFTPTTGLAANKDIVIDTTPPSTPAATPAAGTYTETKIVTLASTGSITIYYTTNGDTPTTSSTLYSSAISVNSDTTIKALSVDAAGNESSVLTAGYVINLDHTAPTLETPTASAKSTTATISWTTNESSDSTVTYGLTSSLGSSETDGSMTTSHSLDLSGLKSCAKYYFAVSSADAATNRITSDTSSFYTTGCEASSVAASSGSSSYASEHTVTLTTDNGSAKITASNGFYTQATTIIQINKLSKSSAPSTPTGDSIVSDNFFNLLAVDSNGSQISTFSEPITFVVNYGSDIESLYDESTLDVYKYSNGSWTAKDCTLDTSANTLTCSLSGFSTYGVLGESVATETSEVKFTKDTRCHWQKPDSLTWAVLEPTIQNGKSGMLLTWTQYSADKVSIYIDDGTNKYPWKINKTANDGHEFLVNVQPWQSVKLRAYNHCSSGEMSIPISKSFYPTGWFNVL